MLQGYLTVGKQRAKLRKKVSYAVTEDRVQNLERQFFSTRPVAMSPRKARAYTLKAVGCIAAVIHAVGVTIYV